VGYDAEVSQPLARGDWEQREIYAKFGLAIYFCQVVETGLVNYLLLLLRATETRATAPSDVDELFIELFGGTLGRNVKRVKRVLGEHGDWLLADQMDDVLQLRNELVHSWMRTRSMLQGTSEGRLAMIDELEGATSKLGKANEALQDRTQAILVKSGAPESFLRSEYRRLTDLAERGEAEFDAPVYFSKPVAEDG